MAFVNRRSEERREERAGQGEVIDFDPADPTVVKVHYDLASWSFDQRGDLSEALAEAELPHAWDGEELVVPELVEEQVDAVFERLEAELGPFPIVLADDAESTEFGLDEWTDVDRALLTESLVESEVPHRWEGTTVVVAQDAEDTVDDLLDAIEAGELLSADRDGAQEAPDGALESIFLAADRLARDPLDVRARDALLDIGERIQADHPPYAFAPRTWARAVSGVEGIVEHVHDDATGERPRPGRVGGSGRTGRSDDSDPDSDAAGAEVAERARALRDLLRPFV